MGLTIKMGIQNVCSSLILQGLNWRRIRIIQASTRRFKVWGQAKGMASSRGLGSGVVVVSDLVNCLSRVTTSGSFLPEFENVWTSLTAWPYIAAKDLCTASRIPDEWGTWVYTAIPMSL